MPDILIIIATIVLIFCLLGMFFVSNYNKIVNVLYKINISETKIKELLDNKFDLITRCINIIQRQIKYDITEFDKVKNIKSEKPNNYDKDILLTNTFDKIEKIIEDEKIEVKSFNEIVKDIRNTESTFVALRDYYNKYSAEYNQMIRRFPYNIIAKFKKFKTKGFYDNKKIIEN